MSQDTSPKEAREQLIQEILTRIPLLEISQLKKVLTHLDTLLSPLERELKLIFSHFFPLDLLHLIAAYAKDWIEKDLLLWLDASRGVLDAEEKEVKYGGLVSIWRNQAPFTQSTPDSDARQGVDGKRLTLDFDKELNRPVLSSRRPGDFMRGILNVPLFKTFFAVFRDNASDENCIHPVIDCNYHGVGSMPANWYVTAKNKVGAKYIAGDGHGHVSYGKTEIQHKWVVGCAVYDKEGSRVYLDGKYEGHDFDGSERERVSQFYLISSREDGHGRRFVGDIAEIMIFKRPLTPEEIMDVSVSLKEKYKL